MYSGIAKTVYNILLEDEKARNDDKYLIRRVLEHEGLPTDLKKIKSKISFESITRARRKIQATNPELHACEEVKNLRNEMQEDIVANVMDRGAARG